MAKIAAVGIESSDKAIVVAVVEFVLAEVAGGLRACVVVQPDCFVMVFGVTAEIVAVEPELKHWF